MKSNFIQRAVTGALFVIVLVGCILYSPLTFGLLFTLIAALSVHEFGYLLNQSGKVSINRTITSLGAAYLVLALMSFCTQAAGTYVFLPYLGLLLYLMITELYLKKENPIGNWACSMLSQLYIALPFALLSVLAYHNSPTTSSVSYNPILPLSIFVFIWLSDTGAYCVGSLIGKHRLFERISPKKSWEGTIGGGLTTLVGGLLIAPHIEGLSYIDTTVISAIVIVFGSFGDLVESMFKRCIEIKDSGHIMPGHGGVLDRLDSILYALPVIFVYIAFKFGC